MTARKPKPVSAQGACSREDPQPKLSPPAEIAAPCAFGLVQHEIGLRRAVGVVAPIGETDSRPARLYR